MAAIIEATEFAPSTSVNSEQFHPCKGCKTGRIPISDHRKTCQPCREKRNLQSQRWREARRMQKLQGSLPVEMERPVDTVEDGVKKRRKTNHVTSEDIHANQVIINSFAQPANVYEYQSASHMYQALMEVSSKSKKSSFYGHFSIVANPEMENKTQVKLVAKELRKTAKIPLEYVWELSSAFLDGNYSRVTEVYLPL
ncbi:hypothetical protein H0H92_010767 [Tricholoma furcatifolium]|nr:hypothetical protein H0H92_010767 [Tricholoma furcatifolium]